MEITCSGCGRRFIIPDEKIPKGKVIVKVKCPKCGEKTVIELKEQDADREIKPKDELSELETFSYSDDVLPEVYEGTKLALFVGDDRSILERISLPAEDMGYKLIHSSDVKDAVSKLRLHQFDLILLQEGFGGDVRENLVMRYLNRLSMAIRRKIFVVLLSNTFKTMDQMRAYALSVNLILSVQDLDKMKDVLFKAMKRHEAFYKPFFDVMKEIGRL